MMLGRLELDFRKKEKGKMEKRTPLIWLFTVDLLPKRSEHNYEEFEHNNQQ